MIVTILSLWAHKIFCPEETQPFGGAELQLALLAKALVRKSEVSIRFITRGRGPAETFLYEGIEVVKLPYRSSSWTRSLLGSYELYKVLRSRDTDVMIQRGGGIETAIVAYACMRKNAPFVFMTSHDWDVDGTHEKKRGLLYGKAYMYGLKRSSLIVTQSQAQHDMLKKNYGRKGVVLQTSHEIPKIVPEDKKDVLWVGRCEPWKKPEALLRIAETLPQIRFTMVCPEANSREMFQTISAQAESLENVNFIPGVSFEETEQLFAQHRLFVNTSEREGFPNTFVQACKWGTPIVSLSVNPDDLSNKHKIGSCAHGDLDVLIAAVRNLLDCDSEWKRLSVNSRRYAREYHDILQNVEKLYLLLKDLN